MMWKRLNQFVHAHRQTKFFIFMLALYMIAIIWTTIQSYARLEYSRSDIAQPILISNQPSDKI